MQPQKIWKEPVMDGEKEKIIYPVGTPRELAESIVKILDKKFARDIKLLYVEEKTIIADYFVICTGGSVTQIKTLADEVEERLLDSGLPVRHIDGFLGGTWIALDYGFVIVHIFNPEKRDFYRLEKLWDDAEEIDISGIITA